MCNPETIKVGDTLTCNETGRAFAVTSDGFTFNYARDRQGYVFSDEGVDLREKREMLDRTQPFTCYLSGDGKHVTGWKGNILGTVLTESTSRNGWHGSKVTHVNVRDVHGNLWHGKGAGRGICLTLRARKTQL